MHDGPGDDLLSLSNHSLTCFLKHENMTAAVGIGTCTTSAFSRSLSSNDVCPVTHLALPPR